MRSDEDRLRQRFLARHGDAAGYADFADFAVYHLAVERGHLVAGFGKIEWIDQAELLYLAPGVREMGAWEAGAVSHMNEDHGDAIQLYARNLLGVQGNGWVMTGCDPEGCDLRRGGDVLRLNFATPAHDADSLRRQLVALAQAART